MLFRSLLISASTGEGLDELRVRIAELFSERFVPVRLLVPHSEGRVVADLYARGAPIAERIDRPDGVLLVARLPRTELTRLARFVVAESPAREQRR